MVWGIKLIESAMTLYMIETVNLFYKNYSLKTLKCKSVSKLLAQGPYVQEGLGDKKGDPWNAFIVIRSASNLRIQHFFKDAT